MVVLWWLIVFVLAAMPLAIIDNVDYIITFTFYLHAIVIGFMCRVCMKDEAGAAFATVTTFILMFFFVAPIFQLSEFEGYFINNYRPSTNHIVVANFLLIIFSFFFTVTYRKFNKNTFKPLVSVSAANSQNIFPMMVIFAIGAAAWAFSSIELYSVATFEDPTDVGSDIGLTIKHKLFFMIPFAALGFYLSKQKNNRNIFILFMLIFLVLMTKNIIFDRRNALGPVYLAILFMFFWKENISSKNVFMIVTPSLLFIFPILSIFINNPIESWVDVFTLENVLIEIQGHFLDMHYDAWANFIASLQYVETEGVRLGQQILGALLFFVPRDIWADKPIASGQMLGEYLVLYYNLWFTNISFPLPAEGYVDFGIFGLILYAALLGYYSRRLDYFINHGSFVDRTSALYFTFYLLFVLRGSFLPAFAYGAGAYVAINCLPAILSRLGLSTSRSVDSERKALGS
jgi:oligosaccharide repeat unit polymerase